MSTIDVLWLAHLNRNTENAGSDSTINLTINVDGEDILDRDFGDNVGDGEAYLNGWGHLDAPFDSAVLTNSRFASGCAATTPGGPETSWCSAIPWPSSGRASRCRSLWRAD